jgi:pimeloyl-ACP methyl ester carboxylesterase
LRSTWTRITSSRLCAGAVLALLVAPSYVASGEAPAAGSVVRADVRITSADDLSLFVRQYGAGETPIVLLTGGPGYSGDYFEDVALRLGKHHVVILPDQRGTGRSVINPWDASRVTIEASVADVEALRAHSGAEQIVVVGHSWGGVLAMAYASSHGQHVRALVLIGSGGATSKNESGHPVRRTA